MLVEYKTENGIINFVLSKNGNDIKFVTEITKTIDQGFKLIGLTSEITEEQAKMMIDYKPSTDLYLAYNNNALESFRSLTRDLSIASDKWIVLFKPH